MKTKMYRFKRHEVTDDPDVDIPENAIDIKIVCEAHKRNNGGYKYFVIWLEEVQ